LSVDGLVLRVRRIETGEEGGVSWV
jgi:hypothetical protein